MRSSKQRSRNKQNRNSRPSGGNIVNRVFDSSGPEGKVRGTPAQIIEKYAQLHRDAQLAGDRVNAENFAQHAEHYTRMLAEAQRDIDRAREEQEQQHRERQSERDRQMEAQREQNRERDQNRDRDRDRERERAARFRVQEEAQGSSPPPSSSGFGGDPSFLSQPLFPVLVAEPEDDMVADAGLVDTPEERSSFPERRDRPRRDDRAFEPRGDRGDRRGDRGGDRGGEARQPWRDEREAEAPARADLLPDASAGARTDRASAGASAGAPDVVPDAPAESQATPGEDGARPGLAVAEEPARPEKPRRPRRPRQPRAQAADAVPPDAAE